MEIAIDDIIKRKNLTPKISTMLPENKTGKTEAIVTMNQKFPNTLPLKSFGVFSCKNVCDGTITPKKVIPSKSSERNDKTTFGQ